MPIRHLKNNMAFLDEIKLHIEAGRGGDGVVRWRQEKFIAKGGPSGGNGGRGGSVYVKCSRNMHTLSKYAHKKEFKAEDAQPGEGRSKHGRDGKDLIIDFPLGTILVNKQTGVRISLDTEGQKELLLSGGKGGLGNEHFKSSINTTPKKATKGKDGEHGDFFIELELVADIGLIGLPNAGKSSLLNMITKAQAKIGEYPFTTLDPNLGDFYGYIIGDIPGLIEGASEGKGLGVKFLKHIKRTRKLFHLVSFENGLGMMKVYKQIRTELGKFDKELLEKEEIILLTKTDTVEEEFVSEKLKEFQKLKKPVFTLSLYDDESIASFKKELLNILQKK